VPALLWDASALTKRYAPEAGTDAVNALFGVAPPSWTMVVTYIGYAESAASARRKFNGRVIDLATFNRARLLLRQEVLWNPDFVLLSVEDVDFVDGVLLADAHSLNSSDAALLHAYLRFARRVTEPASPNRAC
jgi:hypothetical protein